MDVRQAAPPTTVAPDAPAPALSLVHRRALIRAAWLALGLAALVLFVLALAARYDELTAPPTSVRTGLDDLGLSPRAYAVYHLALSTLFAAGCVAIAALLAWRKPDDRMTAFVALFLLLMGALHGPNAAALEELHPALRLPTRILFGVAVASQALLFFLFPDGRFVPRRLRGPVLLWLAALLALMVVPGERLAEGPGVEGALWVVVAFGAGIAAQVFRYARVSTSVQRQQTKWVVFGVAAAAIIFVLVIVLPEALWPSLSQPGHAAAILAAMAAEAGAIVAYLLIPLTLGIAILRYHLWDIDVLINRALVYSLLTAIIVGAYALVVGGLGTLLQARGSPLLALLAAGLIAVLFQPLRDRLQRGANRLLYGERDEPYAVLSRLSQRLEGTAAPHDTLATIVGTVAEALKLPYAAIALPATAGATVAAAVGAPVADPLRLPLVYGHEPVGELLLGPRARGEAFTPADRRLLADLARLAGVAVHAVRLTADLQHSRERLVTAREEERRRLRRDLHDGLGPALAAQTLKVGSARALLARDPAGADALLAALETDLETALADVRRLVYHLRPPALDDLGLVGALRQTAAEYVRGLRPDGAPGLTVAVEAPDPLPPLPAAVEVAAYRIAQEALTNVVRHARARACVVRLAVDADELTVEIADDGVGLPPTRRAGVGLASMRERATELGGACTVEPRAEGGTRVLARLPLPVNGRAAPEPPVGTEEAAT